MRSLWKWAYVAVSLAFMLWLLIAQWNDIRHVDWEIRSALMAAVMVALVMLFFLSALGWHLILRSLRVDTDARTSIRTWLLSSLGRYLPGGVWGYVSRITMGVEQGIPAATVGLALYLETLVLCAGAITAGIPAVVLAAGLPIEWHSVALLIVLLTAMMHPRALALLRFLPGKIGRAFAATTLPSTGQLVLVYFYYVVFWVAYGVVFVGFVAALQQLPPGSALPIGASMGLSFAVGLVAIFAPGGIGVRESVLYLLLVPYLSPAASLLIAVSSRMWIVTGEAIAVGLTLLFLAPRVKS